MYAQGGAQGGAQAGPDMNGDAGQQDNSKHGDNVQDADFEPQKSVSHSLLEKKESLEEPLEMCIRDRSSA